MDLDEFISTVREHKPIDENHMICLCRMAKDLFFHEGTLLSLTTPITVAGDVHGQFYDVLYQLEIGGAPPTTRYLFLGDYVDRGYYSLETFALLLAYKVKYPRDFFLLRGNHECRSVTLEYGFYEEVVQRYGHPGVWKMCNEVFDMLPMAAVIENKIYCVHGGLSPDIKLVDQVASFERRGDIPANGPLTDMVWSDPEDIKGWKMSQRGAGWLFGTMPVRDFCHNNKLKLIARAHQLAQEGYNWFGPDHLLVTVWGAPNYMYRHGNRAAIMRVSDSLDVEFEQFDAVPDDKRVVPDADAIAPYFA